eukprot:TRINITY_DN382_c0_g1_i1.p1 TRINITY_DN382_c0_g1~~TRINITY_DN382_c0_g1_i1.p1  ORF type:complete len:544 (-),score=96.41 TRINITY_DN382_c0_g1_i1:222-1853(-)
MSTLGMPYGLQAMLKEGYKHLSGVEEAVLKNIDACKELAQVTRTSLGPNGLNKLLVNHLDKIFVTNDASTIVTELEVIHPAAKLIVMAAKAQEMEIGDSTNLVISFAGELLSNAEGLIRDGLHTAEVAEGYELACKKALELLEGLVIEGSDQMDVRNNDQVCAALKGCISSKLNGQEDILCPIVVEACIDTCPQNPINFTVDSVRICKIVGGGLADSQVVRGMVFKRDSEGSIKEMSDAKVAVFAQEVDTVSTETKGTVLIQSAEELQQYSRSEEERMEAYIKGIADAGVKVIAAGGKIGEMAMHFIEKYEMMAIRIPSKFDLRRFCKATGATAQVKLGTPSSDEIGFAKSLKVSEIGSTHVIVLQQEGSSISTIVLRGSTDSILDDVERAADDAINCYRVLCRDSRTLPAGGATEVELAKQISEYGKKQTGLEQYAILQFSESLEVVPHILAQTSGLNPNECLSKLHAAHAAGDVKAGLDIFSGQPTDLSQQDIVDLYLSKWWAIKLASQAVVTVMRVDQIIMAKPAGGPKPKEAGDWDDND